MAKRHNEYSRLLGTVENHSKPLIRRVTEQGGFSSGMGGTSVPASGVPDLNQMADQCDSICARMEKLSQDLRSMGEVQNNFPDNTSSETLPGVIY